MIGHPSASADVLVIGAGPAGLVAARTAADAGRRVVVVDAETPGRTPRGAGLLTPATVASATRLGLGGAVGPGHRVDHVRISAGDVATSIRWPEHPDQPDHGLVIDRQSLHVGLGRVAEDAGAELWFGHEAMSPVVERGFVRGAHIVTAGGERFEARADYVVVADGPNSRFGRALGSYRDPSFPYAVAHHARFESAIHDATEIEVVVGLRDRADTPITGYGWMFPGGDGTVDVGILLFSTSPSFQVLNPIHLLDRFVDDHRDRWHLAATVPASSSGGRIPLGRSVGPAAGPTWLLVGDATGAADPWSGAGIGAAIESGALAGDVLVEALEAGSAISLQRYPKLLDERFEPSYGVGRIADQVLGQAGISRRFSERAARSKTVAESTLRLATGALRPSNLGPAEVVFRVARALGVLVPGL